MHCFGLPSGPPTSIETNNIAFGYLLGGGPQGVGDGSWIADLGCAVGEGKGE